MSSIHFPIASLALVLTSTAPAALIATADFSDAGTWSFTTGSQGAGVTNNSAITGGGGGLRVDKSGSSGSAFLTANLIGIIDTTGFSNISIHFTHALAGGDSPEWNNPDYTRAAEPPPTAFAS